MTDVQAVRQQLATLAAQAGLDVFGGGVRRSSSRFSFGVEHGDYNGTALFGIGTDRFIRLAYKANDRGTVRLISANALEDGLVSFTLNRTPPPQSPHMRDTWARFPAGVNHILQKHGYKLTTGFDAVLCGNIPGGGMSRSASLTLNLILTFLAVNQIHENDGMKVVDMAQEVENQYIGSPCGKLDQLMIYFAKKGMGTHYLPATRQIRHVPLGPTQLDFRVVSLDTGTVRPGLEKSTYKIRRAECEQLVALAAESFGIECLADVRDRATFDRMQARFGTSHPTLMRRLRYIFEAQQRFDAMLDAWQRGDIVTVGRLFREDGIGLRDVYDISGPELETMCDIARTVPGVLGERMLGGGDKGAAGALVKADAVDLLKQAVDLAYPRSRPAYEDRYAVHVCNMVDGIVDEAPLTR